VAVAEPVNDVLTLLMGDCAKMIAAQKMAGTVSTDL